MIPTALRKRQEGKERRKAVPRKSAPAPLSDWVRSLRKKNKELEMLLHVTCHDLRSPLVNVQGFSRELTRVCHKIRALIDRTPGRAVPKKNLRALLEEEAAEAVGFIQSGLANMERLLTQVLQFIRLGRLILNVRPLDMDALLRSIAQTLQYQIQNARAQLRLGPLPPCLGDEVQISQAFTNLLDNALKYLDPNRPGKISVTGQIRGRRAFYCVRDNGIGIAPEDQTSIFQAFRQLNPGQKRGEGLGLAITQRVLQRQHGRIWVESAPNRGSAFHVSLPVPSPAKLQPSGSP